MVEILFLLFAGLLWLSGVGIFLFAFYTCVIQSCQALKEFVTADGFCDGLLRVFVALTAFYVLYLLVGPEKTYQVLKDYNDGF